MLPDDIEVRLGAYNLSVRCEEGVVLTNVTNIFLHPDWDVTDGPYNADVAVIVLSGNVNFTAYIQPISLPNDDVFVDSSYINLSGTIVGWGLAENGRNHEDTPRQADIRTYNDSHCYRMNLVIVPISSASTFCAGSAESNPSRGDSGGGFFVRNDDSWTQYGIISSIITNSTGHVTRTSVAVYTNVKLLKDWIRGVIVQTGGVLGEAIILECKFDNNDSE